MKKVTNFFSKHIIAIVTCSVMALLSLGLFYATGQSGGSLTSIGQNMGVVGNLIVDGNVGIGTTSPSGKLEVNGSILVAPTTGLGQTVFYREGVRIGSIGNDYSHLSVIGFHGKPIRMLVRPDGTTSSDIIGLFIHGTTGNVGIGTTSPGAKLDVDQGKVFIRKPADGHNSMLELYGWRDTHSIKIGYDTTGGTSPGYWFETDGDDFRSNIHFRNTATGVQMTILRNGNVGIGTTSPGAKMDIRTTGKNVGGFRHLDSANSNRFFTVTDTGDGSYNGVVRNNDMGIVFHGPAADTGTFFIAQWGTTSKGLKIFQNGFVGIGIPWNDADPTHRIQLPNTASGAGRGMANSWVTYSSIRYKDEVITVNFKDAIEKIMALNPVSFRWKEDGKNDIGFIAEEVGLVVPEAVEWEGEYADGLSISQIVSYLTKVAQGQQEMIDNQQKQIDEQKEITRVLQKQIEELRVEIESLKK